MDKKLGFMLVTFCVYLAVFAIMSVLTVRLIHAGYRMYRTQGVVGVHVADAYVAQDLLMRDLRMAPAERALWREISPHKIVWESNGGVIGWLVSEGSLVRIQGIRKRGDGGHMVYTRSVAVKGVLEGAFVVQHAEERVRMVRMDMHIRTARGSVPLRTVFCFHGCV